MEQACLDPAFRTWAAEMSLSGSPPDPRTALRIITSARGANGGANILPVTKSLKSIVGPRLESQLVADPEVVGAAWMTVEYLLGRLSLHRLIPVVQAVDLIAGLHGPRGEIRSLSSLQFPGFAAIGVENPPLILAEQAVHESAHVTLAARIALDTNLMPLTDERVGILSPFTNSVRTIERVSHGILSYAAVRHLWRAVALEVNPEFWMELQDREKACDLVARRLRTLDARLALAMICLFDAAGIEVCNLLVDLAADLLETELDHPTKLVSRRREVVTAAGYPVKPAGLGAIQRAELGAATRGDKVSRVTLPFADISKDGFALVSSLAVVASSWVIRSVPDPRIGQFSNISGDVAHVLDADSGSEVHLYLHRDPALAREAAILDMDDQAGELLGIPTCCREWFLREWPAARQAGGDAFAVMINQAASGGTVIVASECDASAMYRGGGLCWHFPCSPSCPETIRIVRERRERLMRSDPSLLMELETAYRYTVTIREDGTYVDHATSEHNAVIVHFK
ncbi:MULTISPECIES: HEXXH motif-containing putative peptide modification protein [unclassified Mesorhizobium]|uniref:aKG-HExxH-type peptide beta-hydroxylase n=1 Tax=unclassified Mesorhizobium TaxID=325217 RepID=UPI0018DE856D|nr:MULTISPECIES: HEXXH motif-containing putative peptide modification protein [unclassified Mesorhizobium]WJI79375.1 HEXXH motif-containing putative peptide modification protein [Mesorhizobium sp. C374B]WJI85911.1 HEXXH motif-containing putative peptide modification protein [Mesorhizobium sp. C372A]